MKLLRTPDEEFEDLIDFPYVPKYLIVDGIRIHYVDKGPKGSEIFTCNHEKLRKKLLT